VTSPREAFFSICGQRECPPNDERLTLGQQKGRKWDEYDGRRWWGKIENVSLKEIFPTDLEKLAANALRALIHYKPSPPLPTAERTTQVDRNRKAPPSLVNKATNI